MPPKARMLSLPRENAPGQFTPGAGFGFPFRFRHGSVLPLSEDEYERVVAAYSKSGP